MGQNQLASVGESQSLQILFETDLGMIHQALRMFRTWKGRSFHHIGVHTCHYSELMLVILACFLALQGWKRIFCQRESKTENVILFMLYSMNLLNLFYLKKKIQKGALLEFLLEHEGAEFCF